MKSSMFSILIASIAVVSSASPSGAVIVKTTNFISNVSRFNGFEGYNSNSNLNMYTEDGIKVKYFGQGNLSSNATPAEGNRSWYVPALLGYTQITRDDGSSFSSIQFRTYSGWGVGSPFLSFDVLYNGLSLLAGNAGPVQLYTGSPSLYVYYGFTGQLFDEVRIQVQSANLPDGFTSFAGYDAGLYDSIAIGQVSSVPEPSAWFMLIIGLGGVGLGMRTRRKPNVLPICPVA